MKHSRLLYGLLAVLGIVCLPTSFYWWSISSELMLALMPSNFILRNQIAGCISWFFLIGGAVLFTVGIWGFGRRYFENTREFAILVAILVPFFYFGFVMAIVFSMLEVGL